MPCAELAAVNGSSRPRLSGEGVSRAICNVHRYLTTRYGEVASTPVTHDNWDLTTSVRRATIVDVVGLTDAETLIVGEWKYRASRTDHDALQVVVE